MQPSTRYGVREDEARGWCCCGAAGGGGGWGSKRESGEGEEEARITDER
jgi:hypothetical protein